MNVCNVCVCVCVCVCYICTIVSLALGTTPQKKYEAFSSSYRLCICAERLQLWCQIFLSLESLPENRPMKSNTLKFNDQIK